MESEYVRTLEERTARRSLRMLTIEAMGPLTMLGGVIWAIAQPYRLALLHPHGKGFYDWLAQPPLLVVAVGVFFAAVIAPGITEDLRGDE
jgi:hypothetical protein